MQGLPDNYILTISKQELAALETERYGGKIRVIDDLSQITDALTELKNASIIGFDTETRPSFKRGQTHQVALLQLSSDDTCFLFRLNIIGMPQEIIDLLSDGSRLKVGLSIHDDFHNLNKIQPFTPDGFIDLQTYVKQYRIADNSLARIYAIIFGKRISKNQRLTNWEATELTPGQKQYASLDAVACTRIYSTLSEGFFDPSKSRYIHIPEEEEKTDDSETVTESTK